MLMCRKKIPQINKIIIAYSCILVLVVEARRTRNLEPHFQLVLQLKYSGKRQGGCVRTVLGKNEYDDNKVRVPGVYILDEVPGQVQGHQATQLAQLRLCWEGTKQTRK